MNPEWNRIVVQKIALVLYVEPNKGKNLHQNRPFHGFVLNDEDVERDYIFSDGRILHTKGNMLFYLPKGSNYQVKHISGIAGCYAVNFDADVMDQPFEIQCKDPESLRKHFKTAAAEWQNNSAQSHLMAMELLYRIVRSAISDQQRPYFPNIKMQKLAPAIQRIHQSIADTPTVEQLAQLCGISTVYFRKLFAAQFGLSPKEYIIRRKMEWAGRLLASGEVSVTEAASLCGYAEPCHFSREFSKRFGVAPSRFDK